MDGGSGSQTLAPKLNHLGIKTVYDMKLASPSDMRTRFSLVMEKMIRELNGTSCIDLEEITPPKKEIVCSRSFGIKVTALSDLEEAVCSGSLPQKAVKFGWLNNKLL